MPAQDSVFWMLQESHTSDISTIRLAKQDLRSDSTGGTQHRQSKFYKAPPLGEELQKITGCGARETLIPQG